MSPSGCSADAQVYARILARLAHRFVDRSAIFELRGLDELGFDALERRVTSELVAATRSGNYELLAAFGQELISARLALITLDPDPPTVGPVTLERSTVVQASAGDRDRFFEATATEDASHHEVDVLDLMETLHSTAGGNRPPTST